MKRRPRRLGKIEVTYDLVDYAVKERRNRVIDLSKYNVGFEAVQNKPPSPKPKETMSRYYANYQKKLEEGQLDKFSTRDMMYFFRDKAEESGVKYVIANPKICMRHFKLTLERGYKPEEVLSMIEFLFTSGQTYLDITKLHTGILTTNWCNTIYQDTLLWLDDKFVPNKNKKLQNREWLNTSLDNNDSNIGEW